jgi:hypothetical protein
MNGTGETRQFIKKATRPSSRSKRQHSNLSSAIRLFVLDFYQAQIKLSAKQPR